MYRSFQDKMETSKSVASRSAATTTVGGAGTNGRVRRVRSALSAAQTTAPAARGRTARAARARMPSAVRARGGGRPDRRRPRRLVADDDDGHRQRVGRQLAVAHIVYVGSGCGGRGSVHRRAVPGSGQWRAVELLDYGCGHRAERVLRARVSHLDVTRDPSSREQREGSRNACGQLPVTSTASRSYTRRDQCNNIIMLSSANSAGYGLHRGRMHKSNTSTRICMGNKLWLS